MTETLEARVRLKINELIQKFSDENQLRKPAYTPEENFESLGLRGLDASEILIKLEDEFEVNFDELCAEVYKRENQGNNPCFEGYDHKIRIGEIVGYILEQKKAESVSA